MKNQSKFLLALCSIVLFSSCAKLRSVETHTESQAYGKACESPKYVATVAREADNAGAAYLSTSLRLSVLLKEAQAKYGDDVTIENVRWDLQNGKRRSVVYDVVRCK